MTLVVAGIHDEDRISIASDTKLTWDYDAARTSRTYENALAKVVILREDVAVGVAGYDPHGSIRQLIDARDCSVEELVEQLRPLDHAAFVVAALKPARLWMVDGGEVAERTDVGRAWVGDPAAYNTFQARYHDWPGNTDGPFRLMSSLQWLTSFNTAGSVGGYTIRASGTPGGGFLFVPDVAVMFPVAELFVFAGRGQTRGAVGLLHPHAGEGWLFRHESPDESVSIPSSTPEEFVRIAQEQHGQEVVYSPSLLVEDA
jgi:hypothetical protein